MAERFSKSPALDYLGILDATVAVDVDLAAWRILEERDAERRKAEAEAEAEAWQS